MPKLDTQVKERPVIQRAEQVRAILDGTRTQMRVLVKPQPKHTGGISPWTTLRYFGDGLAIECGPDYPDDDSDRRVCPLGKPGDRLWCQETWQRALFLGGPKQVINYRDGSQWDIVDAGFPNQRVVNYGGRLRNASGKWRPSVHMPRWASRLTLEITDVRVQRLQEISDDDCRAEGFVCKDARVRNLFAQAWTNINGSIAGKEWGWNVNPWVFAISFMRSPA